MSELGAPAAVVFLRTELVRAAARRRSRGRSLVVALAALLAAAAGLVAARPLPAVADVRVDVRGDRLLIRLVDLEHRPDHIEGVLRGLGLDVAVVGAPVGPSEVGRFVGTVDDGLDGVVRRIPATTATFEGFSVPVGWDGRLELRVGRPARADEPYAVFSDALAPREPLACEPLLGRPASEVLPRLTGRGFEVLVAAGADRLRPPGAILPGPEAALPVRAVDAAAPHRLVVRLGPPSPVPITATSPECPT